jgi:hypothetical protein
MSDPTVFKSEARILCDEILEALGATPSPGTVTDAAALTITAGETSQEAFPANEDRRYLFIMNPSDADEVLYVNFGDDAADDTTSLPLVAGAILQFEGPFVPKDSINLYAETTGHAFIAKEGE